MLTQGKWLNKKKKQGKNPCILSGDVPNSKLMGWTQGKDVKAKMESQLAMQYPFSITL